jgi:hypothetical protein
MMDDDDDSPEIPSSGGDLLVFLDVSDDAHITEKQAEVPDDVVVDAFEILCRKWLRPVPAGTSTDEHICTLFDIDTSDAELTIDGTDEYSAREVVRVGHVRLMLHSRRLDQEADDVTGETRASQLARLETRIGAARDLLYKSVHFAVANDPDRFERMRGEEEHNFECYVFGGQSAMDSYHSILRFILGKLAERNYRRLGRICYAEKKVTVDGTSYNTHAWEAKMDILHFIHTHCQAHLAPQQWANKTGSRNRYNDMVEELCGEHVVNRQFPKLEFDEMLYASRTGLVSLWGCFFPYNDKRSWTTIADDCEHSWHVHGRTEVRVPVPSRQTCAFRYFDAEVPDEWDMWLAERSFSEIRRVLPTPALDKIVCHQKLDERAELWLCARFGFALVPWLLADSVGNPSPVQFKSNKQVCMMMLGRCNSGKGMLLRLEKGFFPPGFVFELSSKGFEPIFGRFPIAHGKKKFIGCSDMMKDMFNNPDMEETMFSMISKEELPVPEKGATARGFSDWPDVIIASNTGLNNLARGDKGEGALRRVLTIPFKHRVTETDTTLDAKLKGEALMCALLFTTCWKHCELKWHDNGIWDRDPHVRQPEDPIPHGEGPVAHPTWIVGDMLYQARIDARRSMDVLYDYISRERGNTLQFAEDAAISVGEFVARFKQWRVENDYRTPWTFSDDAVEAAFHEFGLALRDNYQIDTQPPQRCILGMRAMT